MSGAPKEEYKTSDEILRRMSHLEREQTPHWVGMIISSFATAAPAADEDIRWLVGELATGDYCQDIGNQLEVLGCNLSLFLHQADSMEKMWVLGIGAIGLLGITLSMLSLIKLRSEYLILDHRLDIHDFVD